MKAVRANVPVPYGVSPHIAGLGIYVPCMFAFACASDCCQTDCLLLFGLLLKDSFILKWKTCHPLLTLMLF